MRSVIPALFLTVVLATSIPPEASGQNLHAGGSDPLTIDHYVPVVSKAPSMEGDLAQLYVRERVLPGTALRSRNLEARVIIFVHGAGTPAEVAFDPPGASWMAFLAEAGYDAFSMDMTGYGRSTRPPSMNAGGVHTDPDSGVLLSELRLRYHDDRVGLARSGRGRRLRS